MYLTSHYITICVSVRTTAEADRQHLPPKSRRLWPGRILHRPFCCLSHWCIHPKRPAVQPWKRILLQRTVSISARSLQETLGTRWNTSFSLFYELFCLNILTLPLLSAFSWICLDAEVAIDACFYQYGTCRRTLFNQKCSSRYVTKSHIEENVLCNLSLSIYCGCFGVSEINLVESFSVLEDGTFP